MAPRVPDSDELDLLASEADLEVKSAGEVRNGQFTRELDVHTPKPGQTLSLSSPLSIMAGVAMVSQRSPRVLMLDLGRKQT